ncbi:MAG: hypothetical protein JXA42_22090 [Anaerolineales bacterium]|nr:hypothetical protein [Anaerolineales bacterium]
MQRIWLVFFIFYGIVFAASSDEVEGLTARLAAAGFENIAVSFFDTDHVQIIYENRYYRHDVRAAGEVMRIVVGPESPLRRVELIPCKQGVAVGAIEVEVGAYLQFRRGEIDAASFGRTLIIRDAANVRGGLFSPRQQRSFFKTDVTLTVGHQIQLGQYDDRVKIYGQFQPGLLTHLWPGNRVYAEAAIPFHDEIGLYDEGPRLGRLGLSQLLRLPYDTYIVAHGGIFVPERWGVSLEAASFWLQRRVLSGAQWDHTGFFYHSEGTWFYSSLQLNTSKFYLQYYPPWFDMMVGVDWSRYILGDEGWRVTLRRTYRETDIDLYFAVTDYDKFGGVQLRIPLPPARRMRPNYVRVNWPNQYRLSYRATTEVYTPGPPLQTGLTVDTGMTLPDFFKDFIPTHVVKNLHSWK